MTIETVSKSLMLVVLILSFISLVYTLACIAFGGFVFYVSILLLHYIKVRKRAKIRNQYNQAPHLTQDTNGKVKTSQLDITNESQEVSPFPAGDHKASTNRRA